MTDDTDNETSPEEPTGKPAKKAGSRRATAKRTTVAGADAATPTAATDSPAPTGAPDTDAEPAATPTTEPAATATPAGAPAVGSTLVRTEDRTAPTTADPERSTPSWWIPAATFVVGLVLGGSVIYATNTGGGSDAAAGAASASPSASPSATVPTGVPPDRTVTVPGECLALADDSQKVLDLVDQAVANARDLDASGLSDVVRQLQQSRDSLAANSQACRSSVEILPSQ